MRKRGRARPRSYPRLAEQIRALRVERGLSLAAVAKGTGMSASFLSLLENDKSDITLGRLMSLVQFYGVHITDFLPAPDARGAVAVRRGEEQHVVSPAEGVDMLLLAPDTNRGMMPVITIMEQGGRTAEMAQHEGEEFVHVLAGRIAIEFADDEPLEMGEGDSGYFYADRLHGYANLHDGESRFLAVFMPPWL